jgi:IPT/TIG domain
VTLTADVYSSDGGGTLSLTSGGKPISGCANLLPAAVSGYYQATCTHAWSAAGSYAIGAQYSGDVTYGASSASTTITITSLLPNVSSISPNAGPTSGGNAITIHGSNLTGTTAVAFGTAAATNVTVVSDTELTATVPAHAAGLVSVTVTTPKGTSAAARYTYDAVPTVSAIAPASGGQGTVVTVTGTGFVSGSKVKFGTVAAKSSTLVSATQLTATVPTGSGTVDTTVTTPGGTSATSSADRFAYVMPTVSSVSPNVGSVAGGQTVTIRGTNLTGAVIVAFGVAETANATVVSDTELTVTAPPNDPGMIDVVVTTPKGTSLVTTRDRYTYDPVPFVSAIGLNEGPCPAAQSSTSTVGALCPDRSR